jgi:hypothetical protein
MAKTGRYSIAVSGSQECVVYDNHYFSVLGGNIECGALLSNAIKHYMPKPITTTSGIETENSKYFLLPSNSADNRTRIDKSENSEAALRRCIESPLLERSIAAVMPQPRQYHQSSKFYPDSFDFSTKIRTSNHPQPNKK